MSEKHTLETAATSISRRVHDQVRDAPWRGRVLGVYAHACTLAAPDGRAMAVVTAGVGNGPLNVVIGGRSEALAVVRAGMAAVVDRPVLRIGPLRVDLGEAELWEPRPDWAALRAGSGTAATRLPALQALAEARAPDGSLLRLPPGAAAPLGRQSHSQTNDWSGGSGRVIADQLSRARRALAAGWAGDPDGLRDAAQILAGMGAGLTPAGDDFLAGAMLRAWLLHPAPEPGCQALADQAAPRTTTLAAALLMAAARGECSAAWHMLLNALTREPPAALEAAVDGVLAHGATSGADMLAGFLLA